MCCSNQYHIFGTGLDAPIKINVQAILSDEMFWKTLQIPVHGYERSPNLAFSAMEVVIT